MADEFQVQTRGVSVEVVLLNSTVLRGRLFLHDVAEHHDGGEKVEDVLDRPEKFFPLAVREAGVRTVLVNKDQTLYIRVPTQPNRVSIDAEGVTTWAVQLTLEMVQGGPLSGTVFFAQPPGRDRTLDGLNGAGKYLCLVQETSFCYVNLESVVMVKERGPHFASVAPPAP